MASRAAVMTEDDDLLPLENQPVETPPSADVGHLGNRPGSPAPKGNGAAAPQEDEFEVVEVDDNFQPLGGETPEGRMTEAENTSGTYLEQQNQQPGDTPQRRPEPKPNRRERQRAARDRTTRDLEAARAEIAELREIVGRINPRLSELDRNRVADQVRDIDRQIEAYQTQFFKAEQSIKDAVINQDGEALTQAMRERDQAVMQGNQLTVRKNMLVTGSPMGEADARTAQREDNGETQVRREAPPPQPAAVRARVEDFASQHPWYNPTDANSDGFDDSQIVLAIDRAVARAGFKPNTDAYWDEVEDRMRRSMPWRFEDDDQQPAPEPPPRPARATQAPAQPVQQPTRRGPMTGAASEGTQGAQARPGKNQVLLSPQRKEALQLAGALDNQGRVLDREKYNRLLKGYQRYDSENSGVRQ